MWAASLLEGADAATPAAAKFSGKSTEVHRKWVG